MGWIEVHTRGFLVTAARRQRSVTYKDVAGLFKDRRFGYRSKAIVELLGEISADEHGAGRPLLSAVVVRSDVKLPIPGPGFFRLARQLGSIPAKTTEVDYWRAEFRRVCQCPWP
jgi:hypothetical protein